MAITSRHHPRRHGGIWLWLLVLLVMLGSGGYLGYRYFGFAGRREKTTVISHVVTRGPFESKVVERGEVESSSNVEVRCRVEARNGPGTALVEVIEEGTVVEAGQVLATLDATALEQESVQQQITCNTKEAAMIKAQNDFEAAEIAKQEYMDGTYHQEEQTIRTEILIAEEDLRRAQEYLAYSERLAARGYVTAQQLEGDEFAVEKFRTELATANTKLRVLRDYTKPKMLKELESTIKSAEAQWKSEQSSYELELSKLKDLQQQIEYCTITAPQAGQVIYANERSHRGGNDFVVEAGAVVRENQVMFRLPDAGQMQVKAKINEARITMVQSGMSATVRLDALGDKTFQGVVTRVNEYPEPSSWFSSQIKEYATFIQILDAPGKIRPGLTAEVTIHVKRIEDVLTVPVQAIVERDRYYYCVVQEDGQWQPRAVQLSSTNDKFVVVNEGVSSGDEIALNPKELQDDLTYPDAIPADTVATVAMAAAPPPATTPATAVPAASSGQPDVHSIVSRIFQRLDTDKDGKISTSEIPSEQASRFANGDANGDGVIDRAELTSSMQQRMSDTGG